MSVQEKDIALAKQGDAGAFERIYSETIKGAYYIARKYLGSDAAAEDVLQESYIKIYERLDMYQTGNFQGWVDTIVANRCKDYLKRKNPLLFSEVATDDEDDSFVNNVVESKMEFQPDAQADYNETKRLVLEIIDQLPADQRMSVMMFYYEEMSVKDIAAACECSENTIKSRLNYGRKAIKSRVEELEKKGTKLYAVPFLPFLVWLFKEDAKACTVPSGFTYASVAGSGAMQGATVGNMNAGSGAINGAAQGVFGKTAGNVATSAAAKTGLGLGAKIAIGVVAALAVAGGVTTAVVMNNPKDNQTEIVTDAEGNTVANGDESRQNHTAVVEKSKEEIDQIVTDYMSNFTAHENLYLSAGTNPLTISGNQIGYRYFWAGDTPIIMVSASYDVEAKNADSLLGTYFYYVDKKTGEVKAFNYLRIASGTTYGFEVYVGTDDFVLKEPDMGYPSDAYKITAKDGVLTSTTISSDEVEKLTQYTLVDAKTTTCTSTMKSENPIEESAESKSLDEQAVQFLKTYEPEKSMKVYFTTAGATECTYDSNAGVKYVTFIMEKTKVMIVSTTYSAGSENAQDLEYFYYDDAAKTFIKFKNKPDLATTAKGIQLAVSADYYDVFPGSSYFMLGNKSLNSDPQSFFVTVSGDTLTAKSTTAGGTSLKWKHAK